MNRIAILLLAGVLGTICGSQWAWAEDAKITGWRGNWNGSFPDADVPAQWGRVSKLMSGVRIDLNKPKDDKPAGTVADFGTVGRWLVVGPFVPEDPDKAIDTEFIKDEASVEPSEGDKASDKAWKAAAGMGSYLNLEDQFEGKPATGWTAYAHTYIYAEQAGSVILRFTSLPAIDVKAWVNGKMVYQATKWRYWWESQFGHKVDLVKGWNRLLVKVVRGKPSLTYFSPWKFSFFFYAAAPYEWAAPRNVKWVATIPGDGCIAAPVMAKDRVFTLSDPFDVACVNKADGKLLWIRSNHYYDTLSDEERKQPAFKDIAPVAAKLDDLNKSLCAKPATKEMLDEKVALQKQIVEMMKKADPKKYTMDSGHPGNCAMTPMTDGQRLWVWLGTGVLACYDMDGNRQWIRLEKSGPVPEHGNCCTAGMADGKVIVFDITPSTIMAFDAKTGKEAWRHTGEELRKQFPTVYSNQGLTQLVNNFSVPWTLKVAGQEVVMLQNAAFRASDGKQVWWPKGPADYNHNLIASAVVYDGKIVHLGDGIVTPNMTITQLPDKFDEGGLLSFKRLGSAKVLAAPGVQSTGYCICASPLYHDGLLYVVDMVGRLDVYDAADPANIKHVYHQNLGFPENYSTIYQSGSCYANPVLLGKNVCVSSHTGTFVVFKAGRKFELVAVNRLENELPKTGTYTYGQHPEIFGAEPLPDGKCLYIRGDQSLYCIGEK